MVVWGGRRQLPQHRRAVRPVHGHLDADVDRGAPSGALLAHRRLDGKPDGGLGRVQGSYLNTGGRYDPATDTWTADLDRGGALRALRPHGGLDGKP